MMIDHPVLSDEDRTPGAAIAKAARQGLAALANNMDAAGPRSAFAAPNS